MTVRSAAGAAVLFLALASSTAVAESRWLLRPDGYGPIRYGMTRAEVRKVAGRLISEGTPDCPYYHPSRHPEIQLLFDPQSKRLLRAGGLSVRTVDGISTGVDAAVLERVYPGRVRRTEDRFVVGSGSYDVVVDVDRGANRQWAFSVDGGTVTSIGSGYVDPVSACED